MRLSSLLSPGAAAVQYSHISFFVLLISFVIHSHLAPFVAISSVCTRSAVWGGVEYRIRGGKVFQIKRPGRAALQVRRGATRDFYTLRRADATAGPKERLQSLPPPRSLNEMSDSAAVHSLLAILQEPVQ